MADHDNDLRRCGGCGDDELLASFIQRFEPEQQELIRGTRAVLRARWPGANELVYDSFSFFVVGYAATTKSADTVISIAAGPNVVALSFHFGASLKDPTGLLMRDGQRQNKFICIESLATLDQPAVYDLLAAAAAAAPVPLPASGHGQFLVRFAISRTNCETPSRDGMRHDGGPPDKS
jgi:hypothetical protein